MWKIRKFTLSRNHDHWHGRRRPYQLNHRGILRAVLFCWRSCCSRTVRGYTLLRSLKKVRKETTRCTNFRQKPFFQNKESNSGNYKSVTAASGVQGSSPEKFFEKITHYSLVVFRTGDLASFMAHFPLFPLIFHLSKKSFDKIWLKNQGIRIPSFIKIAWKLSPLDRNWPTSRHPTKE